MFRPSNARLTMTPSLCVAAVLCALLPFGLASAQVDFEFHAPVDTLFYDEPTGVGHGNFEVVIAEQITPGFPHGVTAWSMSLTHDPTYLVPTALEQSPALMAINAGAGPALFTPNLAPSGGAGVTCGAIYDFLGTTLCFYSVPEAAMIVRYDTVAANLAGDTVGLTTPLGWASLGNPLIPNAIFENGAQSLATTIPGSLDLVPVVGFLRGDANGDSTLTPILEGVAILDHLFNGLTTNCRDAMDANDDGGVDVLDAVHMFVWGFAGGPPPAAPFPNCGPDPTPIDGVECDIPYC
ncbi:MAG: hypothetical protein AAF581_02795 [Planctomycetota bacterium]